MVRTALISFLKNSINTRLLSSYLKQHGHEVTCYFCPDSFNERNLKALLDNLRDTQVSLVGISLVTDDYYPAVVATQAIKQKLGIPVIWGGAHVNVRPEESLRHADMICRGEGEEALLELVQKLSATGTIDTAIRNLWFNHNGVIINNELRALEEDLDKYPFPDFELGAQYVMDDKGFTPLNEKHMKGEYSIMTSRGCPYSCRYCYNNYRRQHYEGKGKYLRARSIGNVIQELTLAKQVFKDLRLINFWDDSFVARPMSDFHTFSDLYKKEIGLPFFALIEPMAFNSDKIKLLRDCGLSSLQVGIQTGSERVNREIYNRQVSNKNVLEMTHTLSSMRIRVVYDIIFNNPYETREDLQETIRLLLAYPKPFTVQGYNLIFYPGTALTERALKDGFISLKPDVEDFSTIEGKADSPIAMMGSSDVSSRFYRINYSSDDKIYLNAVISLLAYRYVPHFLIRYFGNSETPLRRLQLKAFTLFYSMGVWVVGLLLRIRARWSGKGP
jgi:radical SAM superfamily enzyme YgiQ (UPF0313 family)